MWTRSTNAICDGIFFLCQWSISQTDDKQDHIARVESVFLQELKLILGPYFDEEDDEKYSKTKYTNIIET